MFNPSASRGQQAFRIQPDNVTLVEGGKGVLQCHVEGVTGAVQWVKDGLLLGPNRSMPGFPRYSMAGDEGKGEEVFYIYIYYIHSNLF